MNIVINEIYFPIIVKAVSEKLVKIIGEHSILSIAKDRELTSIEYNLLPLNMRRLSRNELIDQCDGHKILMAMLQNLLVEFNDGL